MTDDVCKSCLAISGKERISQIPILIETEKIIVEHIYPAKILGWLVLTPKRHVERISDLDYLEKDQLFNLITPCTMILKDILEEYEKEYIFCFAEKEGFKHTHIHIIPKPFSLPLEYRGPKIFDLLRSDNEEASFFEQKNFHTLFRAEAEKFGLS